MKILKSEYALIVQAINSAILWEESVVDAHSAVTDRKLVNYRYKCERLILKYQRLLIDLGNRV